MGEDRTMDGKTLRKGLQQNPQAGGSDVYELYENRYQDEADGDQTGTEGKGEGGNETEEEIMQNGTILPSKAHFKNVLPVFNVIIHDKIQFIIWRL